MKAINLVHATMRSSAPFTSIPTLIWIPFKTIHYVHRCWRYWTRLQFYKDPNNFAALAAGNAAYFLGAADLPFVKGIAQTVMIAHRILLCLEKQAAICEHCKALVLALKGDYVPNGHRSDWPTQSFGTFLSPSTQVWYKTFGRAATSRLTRAAYHAYLILLDSFQLSMFMMDAAESFSSNPNSRSHYVRELFYNTSNSIDHLINNREKLLQEMNKHKGVIQAILNAMRVPLSADQIVASVSKGLGSVATFSKASKKAQAAFGDLMLDLVKKGLFGFLIGIGLTEFVPNCLLGNLKASWEKAIPSEKRYPPIDWVMLLSRLQMKQIASPTIPKTPPASPSKSLTIFPSNQPPTHSPSNQSPIEKISAVIIKILRDPKTLFQIDDENEIFALQDA